MTSQTLSTASPVTAGSPIQRPVRALLGGVTVWLVGALLTIVGMRVLPPDVGASASYLAFTWMALATVLVALSVRYVQRVGVASRTEGVLVGTLWVATFVALDLVHYALMHPGALGSYATTRLPSYLPVPAITTLVLGWLRGR
jgi:hypothetical protein